MAQPPTFQTSIFNSSFFSSNSDALTIQEGDKRYLNLGGGAIGGSLDVAGTLNASAIQIAGAAIELSLIAGVTPGTVLASKALSVSASRDVATIRNLASDGLISSSDILITNSGTGTTSRVKYTNTTDNANWEFGSRGSTTANNPNTMYWYKTGPGYLMTLSASGCLTLNKGVSLDSQSTYGLQTSELNSVSGIYLNGSQIIDASRNLLNIANASIGALTLAGTLITATAAEINSIDVTAGTAAASKALVLDASRNISNINSLAASSLSSSGAITTSSTTNATSSTTGSIITAGGAGIKSDLWVGGYVQILGRLETSINYNHIICSTPLVATTGSKFRVYMADAFDGNSAWVGMQTAHALKLCTSDAPRLTIDSAGLINITNSSDSTSSSSGCFTTTGGVGIAKTLYVGTGIYGALQTAAQANITSLGTQTALTVSGTTSAQAITCTTINSSSGITGTLQTAAQANITSTGTLTGLTVSGSSSMQAITCTTISSSSGITGTLQTAAQANITSTGTLTGLTVSGQLSITNTTDSTLTTNGSLITSGGVGIAKSLTVGANLGVTGNYVSDGRINLGTASTLDISLLRGSASSAFRIGSGETSKNCMTMQWTYVSSGSNSNRLSFDPYGTSNALVITAAGYVGIGQSAPTVPLYVSGGVASIQVGTSTTATLSAGSLLSGQSGTFSDTCAVYIADGCLKCSVRGIYISSDRRIKDNIETIPSELGERFVRDVEPRKYDLKVDGSSQLGYIAQELCPDYSSVITVTENPNMHADPDDPRSIEGYQLSVSYERVIPILHAGLRAAFDQIDALKKEIAKLS